MVVGTARKKQVYSGIIQQKIPRYVFIDKVLSTVYFRPNFFKGKKIYAEVPKYFNKHP